MDDFSKIDVWALGILLVNMLTLDFPFASAQDLDNYYNFILTPNEFFHSHKVNFSNNEELSDICNLLQNMLI